MRHARILVVEDETKTSETIALYLRREGHDVVLAADGESALAAVRERVPDVVILDLMLPRLDGRVVCRELRAAGVASGIIMLTARSTEEDKLSGLDLGADDYMTKPFSPRELMARVRALLRRIGESDVLELDGVTLDRDRHEARVDGESLRLTPTEFRLLETMLRRPNRTFTRQQLVDAALGDDYDGLERTVDVHVKNLRRKLGEAGKAIVTVFGVGYKLAR
jgi:DNA-binding response OmpR family regulator